jgi:hypothetical protein
MRRDSGVLVGLVHQRGAVMTCGSACHAACWSPPDQSDETLELRVVLTLADLVGQAADMNQTC